MKRSTVCVVVTYGNRAALCLRVLRGAFACGVDRVVLVDNGSVGENAEILRRAAEEDRRILLHRLDTNTGSAGGFARGIAAALALGMDDVLILDDDNLPEPDLLEVLRAARVALGALAQPGVLYAYRGQTRGHDALATHAGIVKDYAANTFLGFSVLSRLRNKLGPRRAMDIVHFPVIRCSYGPYGGLFADCGTLGRIGLPRADYHLYGDDHEYTARFAAAGINQFLVHAAQITDLDTDAATNASLFDPVRPARRVYYFARNHAHNGAGRITNRFGYQLNKWIYLARQGVKIAPKALASPRAVLARVRLVLRAVSDGEKARLGERVIS